MSAINATVVGNLTADPELKFTPAGIPVAVFTIASNERFRNADGKWEDGPASFVRCTAWRELAEHLAESAGRGDRLIVSGVFRQRGWLTKEGEKRTVWELAATEVGAALRYATVAITKARRDIVPLPEDPWARETVPGPIEDEPPF